jgi:curved DNA-binding protein CbpA
MERAKEEPSDEGATTQYYDLLQVVSDATLSELKSAYHQRARECHPDKQQTAPMNTTNTRFRRIQAAWECLRHEDSRRAYDESLRVLTAKQQARRANAIRIEPSDCRGPFVLQDHDDDQEEEEEVVAYIFQCRCGEELDLLVPVEQEVEDSHLMDCPGCSLTYDTSNVPAPPL